MPELNPTIALLACVVTSVAGATAMRWYLERRRVAAEREDPRDTQIRDLQASMKIAKEDVVKARTRELDFKEHLDIAHARINELVERLEAVGQKYESANASLTKEHAEKEQLEGRLKETTRELENLRQQVQEMEIEMSVSSSDDMLEPAGHTQADPTERIEEVVVDQTLSTEAEDGSPSLIQCLTQEMERWKRHCHVLGEELKTQRDKLVNDEPSATINGQFYLPDDLTDIRGIGKIFARKLHDLGVHTFEQLASLNEADIEDDPALDEDFFRRMQRDDWVGQARALQQSKESSPA